MLYDLIVIAVAIILIDVRIEFFNYLIKYLYKGFVIKSLLCLNVFI